MPPNRSPEPVRLASRAFGEEGDLVVFAHGLLGSSRNWQAHAKALARERRVIAVDLRNHGSSPWVEEMTYPALAEDLCQAIADAGAGSASLVGHSMGGKAAMACALLHPEVVERLVVVDVAPVAYKHGFEAFIDTMLAVDLTTHRRRSEVDQALQPAIEDQAVRAFLLQNLDVAATNGAAWRPNLERLRTTMPDISDWPDDLTAMTFNRPTLFIRGERSDYVQDDQLPQINRMFPQARHSSIAGASHWVHADSPRTFLATVETFLNEQ